MIKKKRNMYLVILFVIALVIGIGYAILSSNLNIAGSTTIKDNVWDIHFENVNVTSGSVSATTPTIQNGTNVTYTVTLSQPGDFYEFTVDAKNAGTIDAMIGSISNTGLTTEQKKYMNYSATYSDGTSIEQKQELKANTKETVKVRVEYKQDVNVSDLPNENKTVNLTLNMNYVQANNTAIPVREDIVCRRATTLHTSTCTEYSSCVDAGYSAGGTITYGSLGTSGTLTSGDAFDCDVNGDGEFNSTNERFYYVADLDTNSNYAVLIYYNNTYEGGIDNFPLINYSHYHGYEDVYVPVGPNMAVIHLPTTSQWSNVSLYNTTRKIKDHHGTEYADFSYEGYAARFLTTQEIEYACNVTPNYDRVIFPAKCAYLTENLVTDWWLETVNQDEANQAWSMNDFWYGGNSVGCEDEETVRPAIEVPKSKISY